jgi:hypothetical protein
MDDRGSKTCVRCGRVGYTAFRTVQHGDGATIDVCAHPVPCEKRRGRRRRVAARAATGRPPTSSIAPPDFATRRAAIIGTDAESVDVLAGALDDYLTVEVDRLSLDRRAIEALANREYGVVVVDAQPGDAIALLNDLGRRLAAARTRHAAVVVCQTVGDRTPSLDRLVELTRATVVEKPFDASTFVAAVAAASGTIEFSSLAG